MRFLALSILVACAAFGIGAYTSIPANPEVRFWKHLMDNRHQEIVETRSQSPNQPLILFTGGSSCAFSIDPKIIEDTCEIPAFNLGLPVSSGNKYILHQALEQAHKGDVLVICLEPDTLTGADQYPSTTLSFALATLDGEPSTAAGGDTFSGKITLKDYLNLSRPGPRYLTTWIVKSTTGSGYRYTNEDIRYHGRLETPISDPKLQAGGPNPAAHLTLGGRDLLQTFQNAAEAKGVLLAYSMPWQYTAEASVAPNRKAKRILMDEIRTIMPVIDDGFSGAHDQADHFADTALHLSHKGSQIRSQVLADALAKWIKSTR